MMLLGGAVRATPYKLPCHAPGTPTLLSCDSVGAHSLPKMRTFVDRKNLWPFS
jgi:hypothetical protein